MILQRLFQMFGYRKSIFLAAFLAVFVFSGAARSCKDAGAIHSVNIEGLYHPVPVGAEKVNFIVFGDQGTGEPDQYRVAKAMSSVCAEVGCQFALVLGDNFYPSGVTSVTDSQWQSAFEKPYASFGDFDFWAVPGNHDWLKSTRSVQAEVEYSLKGQRWLMPSNHYAVLGLPEWLSIYGLDTDPMIASAAERTKQASEAETALCEKKGWKFLMGHHPLKSSGEHGPEAKIVSAIEPVMKKCGIQFYLSGHDHDQEHFDAGSYQAIVQGAGSQLRAIGHGDPGQVFGASTLGFALFEVTPLNLRMRFYDVDAKVIHDWSAVQNDSAR